MVKPSPIDAQNMQLRPAYQAVKVKIMYRCIRAVGQLKIKGTGVMLMAMLRRAPEGDDGSSASWGGIN